jgi:hypothetical protein
MTKMKLSAIVLALSLTALPVDLPYSGGLLGAPPAQAGVWDSVKGAAKKAGGAAKAIGNSAVGMGKDLGKKAGGLVFQAWLDYGRISGTVIGKPVYHGALAVGRGLNRAHDAVLDKFKDKFVGKAPPEPIGKPLPKPPAGQPGSWGGSGPKSLTAVPKAIAPTTGTVARDRSTFGRPVGVAAPNTGIAKTNVVRPKGLTDRSTLARPVGVKPPNRGIAKASIVPRKTMRDRSVIGRPVGAFRPKSATARFGRPQVGANRAVTQRHAQAPRMPGHARSRR